MADLRHPKLIYLKGVLFLLSGLLACGVLLLDHPELKTAALLALAIWCFCRFYYFAFYVIEHYVDPQFKFAGLWAFLRYLMPRLRNRGEEPRMARMNTNKKCKSLPLHSCLFVSFVAVLPLLPSLGA